MYDCPGCGESYEIDGEKYDYCPNCGQAIDWTEGEMIDEKKLLQELDALPYIHGRYDHKNANRDFIYGNESMYEMVVDKINDQPKVGEWIPCSGCKSCQHKECEHNGKV